MQTEIKKVKETDKEIISKIQPFDLWRPRLSESEEQIIKREEKVAGVTLWCRVRMGSGEQFLTCSNLDGRYWVTEA